MVEVISYQSSYYGLGPYPRDYTDLAVYVVGRMLAGFSLQLRVIKEIAEGASPSLVAYRYGLSKFRVKGWVSKVRGIVAFGRLWEYKFLKVLSVAEEIGIKPIVTRYPNGLMRCYCGKEFRWVPTLFAHIYGKHTDLVELYAQAVLKGMFGK